MGSRTLLRRILRAPKPISSFSSSSSTFSYITKINSPKLTSSSPSLHFALSIHQLGFSSHSINGPAPIDHSSMLLEDEYQKLANSTIHHLLEKLEEYGDSVDIEGFDVDYGTEVLTLKLGNSGTYVINKQAPNRQIWMSSPVSGPSRFDWDQNVQAWIYRRTKQELIKVLETELEQLCGQPITLS